MRRAILAAASALLLGGCASASQATRPRGPASPLELRQAQSRSFSEVSPPLVLKAALNVLQDEGYSIREVNADLGIVTGMMEWRSGRRHQGLRVLKWVAAIPTYGASLLLPTGRNEFSSVEANVNVTAEGTGTRVRISLVSRVIDEKGTLRGVMPIDDPLAYQSLLVRLDKAVYLQREGL
jgi:hypothetical protein